VPPYSRDPSRDPAGVVPLAPTQKVGAGVGALLDMILAPCLGISVVLNPVNIVKHEAVATNPHVEKPIGQHGHHRMTDSWRSNGLYHGTKATLLGRGTERGSG
jgi:hypothetical protein